MVFLIQRMICHSPCVYFEDTRLKVCYHILSPPFSFVEILSNWTTELIAKCLASVSKI